ncbi:hypothetical protein ACGFIR_24305 [Micromonospora sp. NPDC049051]|uniref:hypothetical protein n=1 Tax=unclassified Micromonospora TaxID=2617518 RepID=UPI003723CC1E
MTGITIHAINESLTNWPFQFTALPAGRTADMPEAWQPIAAAKTPPQRIAAALTLWPHDIRDLLPRFSTEFAARLEDVVVGQDDDGVHVLLYPARDKSGRLVTWVGYDPRTVDDDFPDWVDFPEPLARFLHQVHAGFVAETPASFGPTRPAYMENLNEALGVPEGIDGWDADIPPTRLLRISNDGGTLHHCLSPDLPLGTIAITSYELDTEPLWPALDALMTSGFDGNQWR